MKIDELLPKLEAQAEEEVDFFAGKAARRFFIEQVGAKSVDDLLGMYDPEEHNTEWDSERQKKPPDRRKLEANRRAVAAMESARLGMYRRYVETELSAAVVGRSRATWRINGLDKMKSFTKAD